MTLPAAVLFDMDGLLVDTEPVWTVAEEELARELGGTFTPELKAAIVGTRLEVSVPTILRWYDADTDDLTVARTSQWLLDRMVQLFTGELTVLPGVIDLLAALQASGVPTALVSSSYRNLVDAVLAHEYGHFDLSIAGDEVQHGKPHPEPYLTACARLGADPVSCIVLEDSPSGVASGEAAGCAVIAVPSVPGVSFESLPRRVVLPSLEGVSVADLSLLIQAVA